MTEAKVFPTYRLVFVSSNVTGLRTTSKDEACLLGETALADREMDLKRTKRKRCQNRCLRFNQLTI